MGRTTVKLILESDEDTGRIYLEPLSLVLVPGTGGSVSDDLLAAERLIKAWITGGAWVRA